MHEIMLITNLVLIVLFLRENRTRAKRRNEHIGRALLRPSQIVIGYTVFFYALGACFFASENVWSIRQLMTAERWVVSSVVFYAAAILIAIYATNRIRLPHRDTELVPQTSSTPWGYIGLIFIVLYVAVEIEPILLFGTTLFFAAAINYNTSKTVFWVPFIIAALIFIPLAADSKRLLIFPILIATLLMWRDQRIKGSYLLGAFAGILILILPMSIARGYGGYNAASVWDAMQYVDDYVTSVYFLQSFGNNIEAVSFYFHGMNALNLYLNSAQPVYGETIANLFFLGSSAYGFQDGLRSSIEIYTVEYDPGFRHIGGSYPIALLSEVVLNFRVFALVLFPALLLALDGLFNLTYRYSKEALRFASQASILYATLLLSRGASFDLYLYNIIFMSLPLYILPMTFRWKGRRQAVNV